MTKDLWEMLSSTQDRMNWSKYQLHFNWVNEDRIFKPPRQYLGKLSQVKNSGNHQWSSDKPTECFLLWRNSKLYLTTDEGILTMSWLDQEGTIGSSLEATAYRQANTLLNSSWETCSIRLSTLQITGLRTTKDSTRPPTRNKQWETFPKGKQWMSQINSIYSEQI